jgi:hypothetical protein
MDVDLKYLVYTKDCLARSRAAWSSRKPDEAIGDRDSPACRDHRGVRKGCRARRGTAWYDPCIASDLEFYRSTSHQRDHRERSRKPLWRKSPWVRIPLPPPCCVARHPGQLSQDIPDDPRTHRRAGVYLWAGSPWSGRSSGGVAVRGRRSVILTSRSAISSRTRVPAWARPTPMWSSLDR